MCEANAYLIKSKDKDPELIMEAVDTVEPEADGLKLVSIFGEQKFIKASVHSMSLVDHRVYLIE
ncbi:MAG: CooT family nickel-binding protein [Desulfobacteraceae bacterium]|nr:CooT family nickel-binding protein [Desulfobacteraceae bacterium]